MKRTFVIASLVLVTLFGFSSVASAAGHWGFGVGFGTGGVFFQGGYAQSFGYPRHCHYVRHVHVRVPVYTRVWVPAVYETVCVGRDRWGYPVHQTVLVTPACYKSVVSGYRRSTCGVACR